MKTVGITKESTIVPDYDIDNAPADYSALPLIGGMSWCTEERAQTEIATKTVPFVKSAIDKEMVVGAICDATTFLGANG